MKLSVVIFPHQKKYAAMCLELSTVSVKETPEEAAAGVTKLIDGLILFGLKDKLPLEKLRHDALKDDVKKYKHANPFQYEPHLAPDVQKIVKEIDYRLLRA